MNLKRFMLVIGIFFVIVFTNGRTHASWSKDVTLTGEDEMGGGPVPEGNWYHSYWTGEDANWAMIAIEVIDDNDCTLISNTVQIDCSKEIEWSWGGGGDPCECTFKVRLDAQTGWSTTSPQAKAEVVHEDSYAKAFERVENDLTVDPDKYLEDECDRMACGSRMKCELKNSDPCKGQSSASLSVEITLGESWTFEPSLKLSWSNRDPDDSVSADEACENVTVNYIKSFDTGTEDPPDRSHVVSAVNKLFCRTGITAQANAESDKAYAYAYASTENNVFYLKKL